MLTYFQSIILGGLQGITELFPVSSLGHSVILPSLLKWNVNQQDPAFLNFLVATHLATALVLFGFFFDDWIKILGGMIRSVMKFKIEPANIYGRLGWLLVVGTIPAGILGLLLQKRLQTLFASAEIAALFLIVNGCMLYIAEGYIAKQTAKKMTEKTGGDEKISRQSWMNATKIGLMQCLALIPGLSRTGSTVTGGLFADLSREDAARFAFLLATPIIFAAGVLKLPALLKGAYPIGPTLIGALTAALGAYISVKFLTNYLKTKTFKPFALYCVLFGVVSLVILFLR